MADQKRPGWYDDGQGQERWWDGRGWTAIARRPADGAVQDGPPVATASITAADSFARGGRAEARAAGKPQMRRRTALVLAAATGVLGLAVGASGTHPSAPAVEATDAPAYTALLSRFEAASSERDELTESASSARSSLTAQRDALSTRADALDEREAHLQRLAEKLDARKARLAAAADTSTSSASDEAASTTVYFQNCDAARAAGAAPVHAGDPGYGSHLDRDGDGIGCE